MNWSPQQRAIFSWCEAPRGNLIVRARAGTGKTTTIVEAIGHIGAKVPGELYEGVNPDLRILLCAFNKRVQEELMHRITTDTRVDVKTLHALGYMYLKATWGLLTVDNDVDTERVRAALGEGVPWEAVTATKKLVSVAKGALPFGSASDLVDLALAQGIEVEAHYGIDVDRIAKAALAAMAAALDCDPAGRITFDDMLYVPVVKAMAVPLYDWVIVDEAQDMNAAQLAIALAAVKPGGHIVVVGDDRQAIYGFRGADSGALDRLKVELAADELGLTVTYRCPRSVVAAAQRLVPDIEAAPNAHEGACEHIDAKEVLDEAQPGDAILSRVNAPLVPLCLGLIRRGIPARIEGRDVGKLLADRVKKLKADDVDDLLRRLARWAKRSSGTAIARGRCVEQRLTEITDVEETIAALADGCSTVAQVLARCESMFGDTDAAGAVRRAAVVLSSVHKAKGLEWNRVFLLMETLYCYGKRVNAEEKNIEYVAITRAKQQLLMVGERMVTV